MKAILNLGCGNKIISAKPGETVVNHDRVAHRPEISVVHDLNSLPWPWEDNTFDLIVACAVLEHLRCTLIESVGECWRILKPGGRLQLKVPYWAHDNSYADPTHYWRFSPQTFDLFDPETKYGQQYGFYAGLRRWKLVTRAHLNPGKSSLIALLEVRK